MTMTNTIPNTEVKYEWVSFRDIAEIYDFYTPLLIYYAKSQGLPIHRVGKLNYCRSCDVEILKLSIAKYRAREEKMKDPVVAYNAMVKNRTYQNRKRKAAGLPPLPRLTPENNPLLSAEELAKIRLEREKARMVDVDMVFEYKDRIKRGKLIGGNLKAEPKTALFRFVNTAGLKEIASVAFEKVHYDAAELENYIVKIHKQR